MLLYHLERIVQCEFYHLLSKTDQCKDINYLVNQLTDSEYPLLA